MKQFLLNLLGVSELTRRAYNLGAQAESESRKERDAQRVRINYPVGTKVMIIGNSPPPKESFGADDIMVAEVIGYMSYGKQVVPPGITEMVLCPSEKNFNSYFCNKKKTG